MVLKTNAPKAGDFEEMDDGEAAVENAQAPEPKPVNVVVNLPTVQASGAVTVRKPAALNVTDHDVLAVFQNRLPAPEFGEGNRAVATNGQFMDGDKKLMGSELGLLLLSWNLRYVVSPGENGEKAKKLARYSLDGVTTSQGENVKEYVQDLKDGGYPKAAVKEYMDLFGLLVSQGDTKHVDHQGKSIAVSLSPDSVRLFNGFRRDLVVKGVTGGLKDLDISSGLNLKLTTEIKSSGENTWTRVACALA